MCVMSLVSLIVSIVGVITYIATLPGLFVITSIASVVLPPIAKKFRLRENERLEQEQEKKGKALEIIAIVIGGFNFYCLIFALTSFPVFMGYLGYIICGIAYKMVW